MAYSTSNPPVRVFSHEALARGLWFYVSTDDENAFDDSNYITNAVALGMKSGDVVIAIDTTNGLASIGKVTVGATAGTLTALTAIS